ncbi:helix-turn-helix domain-containing protein [Magnetospirillum sp. UT-4]|uniref:helix-turn-helix domain-containing protein n=1 Tax=Magnetospirillum sp. UT-4 TaxID=2681467 RepID=UPI00137EEB5A|nr:helix-turn-helix domain-containing protein [Magnetospirillum sp. UT-4]CAA7621106.1 Transcriptional regulator [Magnetospirillum sp. UT-4]
MSASVPSRVPVASKRRRTSRGRLDDGAPNPVDVHIGSRIRLRRVLLGISQEALGHKLGLTFQQVQKYERGANRCSGSRLWDLARVLDVPVSFFFDDMPAAVAAASPAAVVAGTAPPSHTFDGGEFADRRTLELVRNFKSIADENTRDGIYSLIKSLAPTPAPAE